ncbi:MAG: PQQ-binding-like beta-propeller repeat protein [Bryobacteraceae bacterium]
MPTTCLGRLATFLLAATFCTAENWPQFRGPRGDGTSLEKFAAPQRELWRTKLPGPGHSSPIVWGDRIYLTAFERETSITRRIAGNQGRLLVLAIDRKTGRIEWQHEVTSNEIEKISGVNQPATPTPATDGECVYAYFGSFGLVALRADGSPVWNLPIGPFAHHMGVASSPVISGGRVILNVETDGPSFLYSIDKSTGKPMWRVPRKTRQAAYATPVVWDRAIVVAGHENVTVYSYDDGRTLWTTSGLSQYVVPTPVVAKGLLFATSNGPGGNVVMSLGADGATAWRTSRGGAYVASPVLAAERLFTVHRNCVVSCLDTRDGRIVWQQRLPTEAECDASPVVAQGRLHVVTGAGEIFTLEASDAFRTLGKYELRENVLASPAISGGAMFVRSNGHLFALESR